MLAGGGHLQKSANEKCRFPLGWGGYFLSRCSNPREIAARMSISNAMMSVVLIGSPPIGPRPWPNALLPRDEPRRSCLRVYYNVSYTARQASRRSFAPIGRFLWLQTLFPPAAFCDNDAINDHCRNQGDHSARCGGVGPMQPSPAAWNGRRRGIRGGVRGPRPTNKFRSCVRRADVGIGPYA